VLTADHGEAFGEHNSLRYGGTVYEEQVRVPLVIAGKNVKSRVIDQPATLLDLAPTVLDLFGAPTPGSLSPLGPFGSPNYAVLACYVELRCALDRVWIAYLHLHCVSLHLITPFLR
jgi:hypothetical protein